MKRILIVSPHFPPTDAVDSHRVRMNIGSYCDAGWKPTVLSVEPLQTGQTIDPRLLHTLPEGLCVSRVHAKDTRLVRSLGVSAIGLRAYRALAQAGDDLVSKGKFDLVFISTTAFPVMMLGRRWLDSAGIPFVLDFQDPWYTAPIQAQPLRRGGARHALMRRIHSYLERRTLPSAGGLIAVSSRYIEALQLRFPQLRSRPAEAVPFGFSRRDLAISRDVGVTWEAIQKERHRDRITALSVGRVNDSMESSVATLLEVLRRGTSPKYPVLSRLSLMFLGTQYGSAASPGKIAARAEVLGTGSRVTEQTGRVPLLDALKSLHEADVLIVLGSRDISYQPSRLYQCLTIGKPVIVAAQRESALAREAARFPNVCYLPCDEEVSDDFVKAFDRSLGALIAQSRVGSVETERAVAPFESAMLGAREVAVFDRVVAEGPRGARADDVAA